MKTTKKTIRLQFTVFPEYAEKIKRVNTDPFDTESVYLMKLIDRELVLLDAVKGTQALQQSAINTLSTHTNPSKDSRMNENSHKLASSLTNWNLDEE